MLVGVLFRGWYRFCVKKQWQDGHLRRFALRGRYIREISLRIRGVKIAGCGVPLRTMWAGSVFQYHGQRSTRLCFLLEMCSLRG